MKWNGPYVYVTNRTALMYLLAIGALALLGFALGNSALLVAVGAVFGFLGLMIASGIEQFICRAKYHTLGRPVLSMPRMPKFRWPWQRPARQARPQRPQPPQMRPRQPTAPARRNNVDDLLAKADALSKGKKDWRD